VLIDDSLVRGTTSKKIVKMMRDAGAREVHFRIASPPITHPDYYGIDTPDRTGLLAATHNPRGDAPADRRRHAGVPVGRRASTAPCASPAAIPRNPKFTDHCFTGDYPTPLTDMTQREPQPRQLSLLAEAS